MGDSTAIELAGVGKRYWKLEEDQMLLKSILPFTRPTRTEMWALRGLDLAIEAGETVGIIGRNGAGKTTMLRLLAGITRPTEGRVRVRGRVAPLISVGVGFHQEMSGRENVLVNGMLLGLTAQQVAARFDEIVDFADLTEFIDTPVKFYSSGMFMRLGFSVAVHVNPDILLVDEILAVGDAAFQAKCFERLRELQRLGTSIVLVTHQLDAVRTLCERAVLIRNGRAEFDGSAEATIARHYALLSVSDGQDLDDAPVEFVRRELVGGEGIDHAAAYDEPMELRMRLRFNERVEDPRIGLGVYTQQGLLVSAHVMHGPDRWRTFEPGEEADVAIPFRARMAGGTYELAVQVRDRRSQTQLGRSDGLYLFVAHQPGVMGLVDLRATIEVSSASAGDGST